MNASGARRHSVRDAGLPRSASPTAETITTNQTPRGEAGPGTATDPFLDFRSRRRGGDHQAYRRLAAAPAPRSMWPAGGRTLGEDSNRGRDDPERRVRNLPRNPRTLERMRTVEAGTVTSKDEHRNESSRAGLARTARSLAVPVVPAPARWGESTPKSLTVRLRRGKGRKMLVESGRRGRGRSRSRVALARDLGGREGPDPIISSDIPASSVNDTACGGAPVTRCARELGGTMLRVVREAVELPALHHGEQDTASTPPRTLA